MLQRLLDSQSVTGVFRQATQDEPPRVSRDLPALEGDFLADDLGEVLDALDVEGDPAEEKLVGEDANAPHVDLAVVEVEAQHFGREVDGRAAAGVPEQGRVHGPPEVADLDCAFMKEDVLRLDVAVDDVIGMHVVQCPAGLAHRVRHLLLRQSALRRLHLLEQVPSQARLQQQVHVVLVVGVPVDRHDVGVHEVALDDDLAGDLFLHLRSELVLGDDLEAADEVGGDVLDEVDLAVAPLVDEPEHAEDLLLAVELQPLVAAHLPALLRRNALAARRRLHRCFRRFIMNFLQIFAISRKVLISLLVLPASFLRGRMPQQHLLNSTYFLFAVLELETEVTLGRGGNFGGVKMQLFGREAGGLAGGSWGDGPGSLLLQLHERTCYRIRRSYQSSRRASSILGAYQPQGSGSWRLRPKVCHERHQNPQFNIIPCALQPFLKMKKIAPPPLLPLRIAPSPLFFPLHPDNIKKHERIAFFSVFPNSHLLLDP